MNTCELGAVHVTELAYQDWAALAAWADLREMELMLRALRDPWGIATISF